MSEATLTLSDPNVVLQLFGPQDQNVRALKSQLGVTITHRAGQIKIAGQADAVKIATEVLERLKDRAVRTGEVSPEDVQESMAKITNVVPKTATVSGA